MNTFIQYSSSYLIAPTVIFLVSLFLTCIFKFHWLNTIASWLNKRGLFNPSSEFGDEVVINLARIFVSLLLLYRLYYIWEYSYPLGIDDTLNLTFIVYSYLLVSLLIGFLTPLTSLLLLLFQLHINFNLKTYTLGVDVTAMILLCFILFPAGRTLSLDSLFSRRSSLIRYFYSFFSINNRNTQVTLAKALSLLSYGLLCIYSVVMHLDEPLWTNGDAAIHLLSSTYLSSHYAFFQNLFSNSSIAVLIAKLSMIIMVVWYFILLLGIVWGGLFRKLTLIWTVLFFLLSTFILQLSILPYLEFTLLAMWFWDLSKPKDNNSVNMLYDDRCNLCDRTVRTLRYLDLHGVLNFLPVSKNLDKSKFVDSNPEDLYKTIYSWDTNDKTIYSGYDFYLHISKRLILLLPLYPVLWLLKVLKIGVISYKFIASNRLKYFGICELANDYSGTPYSIPLHTNRTRKIKVNFFKPFFLTSLFFAIIFTISLPHSPLRKEVLKFDPNLIRSAHILSWSPISVFNHADLAMSHHYYTATTISNEQLLPLTGKNGERLHWHISDRAYFGNSLRWRRIKNRQPIFPITDIDRRMMCEIVMWGSSFGFDISEGVAFTFYESNWPKKLDDGMIFFDQPKVVGSFTIEIKECKK